MPPVVGTIADLSLFPALCNQHADSVCSRREVDPRRYCGKQVEGEAAKGRGQPRRQWKQIGALLKPHSNPSLKLDFFNYANQ